MQKIVITVLSLFLSVSYIVGQNIQEQIRLQEQQRKEAEAQRKASEEQRLKDEKQRQIVEEQRLRELEILYQNAIKSAESNFSQKNYEQAKQDYLKALELKPENAASINPEIEKIDMILLYEEEIIDENKIYNTVEVMPEFPGGPDALLKYFESAIKYPAMAKSNGITGTVRVNCIINQNGEVTNVKVERGVDPSLDREALRVVQEMPLWTPGKQRNRPVKVYHTIPVIFKLN